MQNKGGIATETSHTSALMEAPHGSAFWGWPDAHRAQGGMGYVGSAGLKLLSAQNPGSGSKSCFAGSCA